MKNKILAGMAMVGIFVVSTAHADTTYTTSKGAVFTQVQGPGSFENAWKDPSGTIWSSYQGDFANNAIKPDQNNVVVDSPATEACAKIGGALPTAQQYEMLDSYFDRDSNNYLTDQGRKDLYAIFPDMQNHWFWTSSVVSGVPDDAYVLYDFFSFVHFNVHFGRDNYFSVRCAGE
jgi:hypothetical protein